MPKDEGLRHAVMIDSHSSIFTVHPVGIRCTRI